MKQTLKAGIVGAGLMGQWHARGITKADGHLLAIIDHDNKAAQHLAAKYNTKSFPDLRQVIDRFNLDVLHICTPLATHKNIAEQAINASVNVIIEKPFTPTALETEHLFDLAHDRGVLICPVHQFVFQNGVQKALNQLPQIGRIVHIDGTIYSAGGEGQNSCQLNTIAADILPHPLSLLQLFLPVTLSEVKWNTVHPGYGELHITGKGDSISISVTISMNARPTMCSLQLTGTKGTTHMDLFHGFSFTESGKVSRTRKITHPFTKTLQHFSTAAVHLGSRIFNREPAYPGLFRLIDFFYRAVKNGENSPLSRKDTISIAQTRDILIQQAGLNHQ